MTRERLAGRLVGIRRRASRGNVLSVCMLLLAGCANGKTQETGTGAPPSPATSEEASMTNEQAARAAADAWLAVVDAGDYAESWTEAAATFKKLIDGPGWEKALSGARAPLGKVISRTLKTATYTTSLPGAPDGQYVVIRFNTRFEKKQGAVETVTPAKEPDGQWRISGYFIK